MVKVELRFVFTSRLLLTASSDAHQGEQDCRTGLMTQQLPKVTPLIYKGSLLQIDSINTKEGET